MPCPREPVPFALGSNREALTLAPLASRLHMVAQVSSCATPSGRRLRAWPLSSVAGADDTGEVRLAKAVTTFNVELTPSDCALKVQPGILYV